MNIQLSEISSPNVYINDKQITPGYNIISEHIPENDPREQTIVLHSKKIKAWNNKTVNLIAIVGGWALAGSMMRWQNGCFGVQWEVDNSTHGTRFINIDRALEKYNSLPT